MAMTYFDGEAAGHAGLDFAAPQHEPEDDVAQCPVAAEGMRLSPSLPLLGALCGGITDFFECLGQSLG